MAYGMSNEELARIGGNINQSGGAVDDDSIKRAMDEEMDIERQAQIDRNRARSSEARIVSAQQKAAMKNRGIMAATQMFQQGLGFAANQAGKNAQAGAAAPTTGSGRIGARAEGLQSRAEVAGERGNVLRQAKLTNRASTLEGKVPGMQAQEKISADKRQALLDQKIASRRERSQTKIDRYNIRQEYGGDKRVGAYKSTGDLYGNKVDEDQLNRLLLQQGLLD